MQHCRQLLHESVSDAFAMQSKLSKLSLCGTQKSEFFIHYCSTCHAFVTKPHEPWHQSAHHIWVCASFQTPHPTTHTLISPPCVPPTKFKASKDWRGARCAYHKRRLEGLCQRAGALITDVVAKEVQFGDGEVGLVLKQPWHIYSQPALGEDVELIWQRNSS